MAETVNMKALSWHFAEIAVLTARDSRRFRAFSHDSASCAAACHNTCDMLRFSVVRSCTKALIMQVRLLLQIEKRASQR